MEMVIKPSDDMDIPLPRSGLELSDEDNVTVRMQQEVESCKDYRDTDELQFLTVRVVATLEAV
jgi:hypothetical protein